MALWTNIIGTYMKTAHVKCRGLQANESDEIYVAGKHPHWQPRSGRTFGYILFSRYIVNHCNPPKTPWTASLIPKSWLKIFIFLAAQVFAQHLNIGWSCFQSPPWRLHCYQGFPCVASRWLLRWGIFWHGSGTRLGQAQMLKNIAMLQVSVFFSYLCSCRSIEFLPCDDMCCTSFGC